MAKRKSKKQLIADAWKRWAENDIRASSHGLLRDLACEAFEAGVRAGQRIERTAAKERD